MRIRYTWRHSNHTGTNYGFVNPIGLRTECLRDLTPILICASSRSDAQKFLE
jgi:hypothetical protein